MKITKTQLKQIIKEELEAILAVEATGAERDRTRAWQAKKGFRAGSGGIQPSEEKQKICREAASAYDAQMGNPNYYMGQAEEFSNKYKISPFDYYQENCHGDE